MTRGGQKWMWSDTRNSFCWLPILPSTNEICTTKNRSHFDWLHRSHLKIAQNIFHSRVDCSFLVCRAFTIHFRPWSQHPRHTIVIREEKKIPPQTRKRCVFFLLLPHRVRRCSTLALFVTFHQVGLHFICIRTHRHTNSHTEDEEEGKKLVKHWQLFTFYRS